MILAISIQKGGTGKTTTAAALAQAAASRKRSVLCIDLDPQANLTITTGARPISAGSYGLLYGEDPSAVIQRTKQGLDVIPASRDLMAVKMETGAARRLEKALSPLRGKYDYIIVDTPPTAGVLQLNALQAADQMLIPLQADLYSLQSLYQVADTARQLQTTNPNLNITGYILTQHNNRTTIARQIAEKIHERAREMDIPFLGAVRSSVAVKEAAALQRSLYEYAPKSNPAQDYLEIFDKLERIRRRRKER